MRRIDEWEPLLARLRRLLAEQYGIDHVTLQPEPRETILPFPCSPETLAPRLRREVGR
jgi:hypothetical protein